MANPNQNQSMSQEEAQQSLMADLYFGTPMGMDNNSGEFNVTAQNAPEAQPVSEVEDNQVQ